MRRKTKLMMVKVIQRKKKNWIRMMILLKSQKLITQMETKTNRRQRTRMTNYLRILEKQERKKTTVLRRSKHQRMIRQKLRKVAAKKIKVILMRLMSKSL